MKKRLRRRLPSAPREPLDRIARGADRWAVALHRSQPVFAAELGVLASRWDDPAPRRIADQDARTAFTAGLLNKTEVATWLAILRTWEAQGPGARMAAITAFTELHGTKYHDPYRVLSMELAY